MADKREKAPGEGEGKTGEVGMWLSGVLQKATLEAQTGARSPGRDRKLMHHGKKKGDQKSTAVEDSSSEEYDMSHSNRGMAVIFNNVNFQPELKLSTRYGSDVDAETMKKRLKELGFKVKVHKDKTLAEMQAIVTACGTETDHSKADCFACVILTYGNKGVVYGTDGPIKVDSLFCPLQKSRCKSLSGKPKLLIIQACSGDGTEEASKTETGEGGGEPGNLLPMDGGGEPGYLLPGDADTLLACSVTPGYLSWRHGERGSWYIQALANTLEKYGDSKEIAWILTRVNRTMALNFAAKAHDPSSNHRKQMPCYISLLTKDLYFRKK